MSDEIKKYNQHSIRDLSLDKTNKKRVKRVSSSRPVRKKRGFALKSSVLFWLASLVVLFFASSLFYVFFTETKAKLIVVDPQEYKINLDGTYIHVAYKEPEPEQLGYKVYKSSKTLSKTLQANEKKYVEEKAKGVLTVYNEFSSNPQRIIKNTRFESPEGKIYRVRHAFTIPGKKGTTPGKIDITVYADEPGSDYNLDKGIKFTLPGLKGDSERYKKIYAVAKTDIKGGFKGNKYAVSEEEKKAAAEELKKEMLNAAKKLAKSLVSKSEIFFDDSVFIKFKDIQEESRDSSVVISLPADIAVVAFDKFDFAKELARVSDASIVDTEGLYVSNPEELNFKIQDKENVDLDADNIVKFTISGGAKLKYYLDKDALKKDLIGKDKSVILILQDAYPALKHARDIKLQFSPGWRSKFPSDPEKIEIVESSENI